MIEHTFEQNKIYANQETYDALIEHFNKIESFAKNKKFEWEDDTTPSTETYLVTSDFNEWFEFIVPELKDYYQRFKYQIPEDLENDILKYTEELTPYINGFMLSPVGMVQGTAVLASIHRRDTFEEIVEYVKELKQRNNKVFLYQVFHKPSRNAKVVEDNATFYEEIDSKYTLRCGVIEND